MLMTIQREVMWPGLIASKILGKRLGSNNFVADFPSSLNSLLDLPNMDLEPADSRRILSNTDDHKDTHNYKLFVSTWNVGGLAPTDDLNIEDLLDTCNTPCDIYVLGFQEVVPLRAANVLGPEKDKLCMKWNSLIRKTLNKNTNNQCSDSKDSSIQNEYHCLISKQMVGLLISVWIRYDLHPYIRNPNVSCVGCGVIGCLGNKGSVSVRFRLHETSFCFVCTHLASGGRLGDEKTRNSNAIDILSRTRFPKGPELDLPTKILDHSQVILLGDLNYRISLPEQETRFLVHKGEWSCLLENDQLGKELMDGQAFGGWHEGTINFPPTYKYCPNSDAYYGSCFLEKGKKKRAPAWCDRIIWFGKGLQQHAYTRSESKLSDHRPVKAIFTSEVRVLKTVKEFRNLFLSERFDDNNSSRLDKESSYSGRSSL